MQIKIAKFGSLNGTFGSIIDKGISARSWFEILKTSKHTSAYTQNMCRCKKCTFNLRKVKNSYQVGRWVGIVVCAFVITEESGVLWKFSYVCIMWIQYDSLFHETSSVYVCWKSDLLCSSSTVHLLSFLHAAIPKCWKTRICYTRLLI